MFSSVFDTYVAITVYDSTDSHSSFGSPLQTMQSKAMMTVENNVHTFMSPRMLHTLFLVVQLARISLKCLPIIYSSY